MTEMTDLIEEWEALDSKATKCELGGPWEDLCEQLLDLQDRICACNAKTLEDELARQDFLYRLAHPVADHALPRPW